MQKFNSSTEFIAVLMEEFPEKVIQLLELEYTETDLLSFIDGKSYLDFDVKEFGDALNIALVFNSQPNQYIQTRLDTNPNKGDLALDNHTGKVVLFDGSMWIDINHIR